MKKKTSANNPFFQYLQLTEEHPEQFPKTVLAQTKVQREMLKRFDFIEEKGAKCVKWIEKYCILPEGENRGKPVKLDLFQKSIIYSIFSFYGYFEEPELNEFGEVVGTKKIYSRVVNDVSFIIASGNGKTTFMSFILDYLLFSSEFNNPNIFIGSNTHQQAKLTFDSVVTTINNNSVMKKLARVVDSRSRITVAKNNSMLFAMSSKGDNQEGINPAVIFNDEIHLFKDNSYVADLKKSAKRSDLLYMEASTQGTVRGGYLDQRLDYLRENLELPFDEINFRTFCAIYEQESEEEIHKAYRENNPRILLKSNPALGTAVNFTHLKAKIEQLKNDGANKVSILTKNFNIPQNAENCFFSMEECRTLPFNEEIFYNAPVFLGLDMAWTRSYTNDLTAISMLMVNPLNNKRYYKDFILLPKYYWNDETQQKEDMVKLKSKYDANIPYNKKRKVYGYETYAKRKDIVIVDEELVNELVSIYGQEAYCDCCGITQNFVIYFIAYLERRFNFRVLKFGLDPNKANEIESFFNANIGGIDGKDICVKFQMEKNNLSNPVLERVKAIRGEKKVYCNNKLTELHFADAQYKETATGFCLTNQHSKRKDAVISQVSAESAYNVFSTNKFTGIDNTEVLKGWWIENEARIQSILDKEKEQIL